MPKFCTRKSHSGGWEQWGVVGWGCSWGGIGEAKTEVHNFCQNSGGWGGAEMLGVGGGRHLVSSWG